jgi:hypothetical protein
MEGPVAFRPREIEPMVMKFLNRMTLIGGALLTFSSVFAACGGDDDDATSTGNATEASPTVKDDGKASDATNNSSPTAKGDGKAADAGPVSGTDKEYVKDICVAFNAYMDGALKAFSSDPSSAGDQAALVKKIGPLLETFAKEVAKAKPPRDVKKYHDELVKQTKDSSEKLKSGKITSLSELGQGVTPPKDLEPAIKARLANAEQDVKECQDGPLAGIGGLFGAGS